MKLLELSGLVRADFDAREVYPDEHICALGGHAAEQTGIPAGALHEKFGECPVPDLMYMYQKLIQPGWKTLDMVEHTGATMHAWVRQEHEQNAPRC